jgi:hypothetical protein
MSGRSAKKRANQAAEEARTEAANYRAQTSILQKRTDDQAKKAQRILLRTLRSRGAGFFETDFNTSGTTLGGAGSTLG